MKERLLAYLLDDLDAEQRQEVEAALASDPDLRSALDQLRDCLQSTESEQAPPSRELVQRTCSLVRSAMNDGHTPADAAIVPASLSDSRDPSMARSRWSLADMAVGLGVLVALAALVFPALRDNRDMTRRMQCQDNLRALGTALVDYTYRYREGLPQIGARENAGMFAIVLAEKELLSREELAERVVCPETRLAEKVFSGCVKLRIPTRAEFLAASPAEQSYYCKLMGGDYAYSLGYEDEAGNVRQIEFSGSPHIPLLADSPDISVAGFQSPNHGGCGQNVIFHDLSCRYCSQCVSSLKRDHWFLNDEGQHAAGRHSADLVLGRSEATPLLARD